MIEELKWSIRNIVIIVYFTCFPKTRDFTLINKAF